MSQEDHPRDDSMADGEARRAQLEKRIQDEELSNIRETAGGPRDQESDLTVPTTGSDGPDVADVPEAGAEGRTPHAEAPTREK